MLSIEYHRVDADSKAEAIRMVDEDESDNYETYFSDQYKPKFESIELTYECPNKYNGWTDVALDVEVGSSRWHYIGMCEGEYLGDNYAGMCSECACAKHNGYRPLTQDELQYLSDSYGVVIE